MCDSPDFHEDGVLGVPTVLPAHSPHTQEYRYKHTSNNQELSTFMFNVLENVFLSAVQQLSHPLPAGIVSSDDDGAEGQVEPQRQSKYWVPFCSVNPVHLLSPELHVPHSAVSSHMDTLRAMLTLARVEKERP